ncbi:MAG: hypothetical protein KJ899_06695 [Gammaproteobacteria bacterium]|nr:hypothetical protein [Gammaproteobacteria bacterium]
MKIRLGMLALCASFATAVQAEGLGVYINGGTTGFGLGLATGTDTLTGRLSFDTWKRTFTQNDSNGSYTGDLKLQNLSALVDWYPFAGTFRTTFGLVANGNKATLKANAVSGTYTFDGTPYDVNDVGSFSAEMKFNSTAPYLGVGWGNPVAKDKTWGFVMDLGVMFQGAPKVTATATCSASYATNFPADCAQMQSDVAAGATQLEEDLKDYKYYPVVSVGLSYRF